MAPTENVYHASDDNGNGNDGAADVPTSPPVMIHVVAPATLPAGYTFEAQLAPTNVLDDFVDEANVSPLVKKTLSEAEDSLNDNGKDSALNEPSIGGKARIFTVTVPEGGVTEGETFLAPLPESLLMEEGYRRIDAPTGHWKDGLFGCLNYGICHPSLWCSLCCTQIAMGQVMQRLRLTFLGHPALSSPSSWSSARNTFKIVVALVIAYTIYSVALEMAALPPADFDPNEEDMYYYIPPVVPILRYAGSIVFTVWAIYALVRTRESVRATYSIPVGKRFRKCPGGERGQGAAEDLCCAAFCSCCTVAQMLRHTGEYEKYEGRCCTMTGHPRGTPAVV